MLLSKKLFDLFSDESKWTKRVSARNAKGVPVSPEEPEATCWCLYGGIIKVADYDYFCNYETLPYKTLNHRFGKGNISTFNDAEETTFSDILNYIYAIADEEAKEANKDFAESLKEFRIKINLMRSVSNPIYVASPNNDYLHSDGIIRKITVNPNTMAASGYFPSFEDAINAVKLYHEQVLSSSQTPMDNN